MPPKKTNSDSPIPGLSVLVQWLLGGACTLISVLFGALYFNLQADIAELKSWRAESEKSIRSIEKLDERTKSSAEHSVAIAGHEERIKALERIAYGQKAASLGYKNPKIV